MEDQEPSKLWGHFEELEIWKLAMLLVGYEPSGVWEWPIEEWPSGYEAMKNLLIQAFEKKEIVGTLGYTAEFDEDGEPIEESITPKVSISRLKVASLREYLRRKGIESKIFDTKVGTVPSYNNPDNPYYAPKLAAAIAAWEAVTSGEKFTKYGTPKKAIDRWLLDHADEYKLSAQGREEVSKVANWKPEGGAPKTPSKTG